MADVHIIGQIFKATDFQKPHIFAKWRLQSGVSWKLIQGEVEGTTFSSFNFGESHSDFSHHIDLHLNTSSVQGWPKIQIEVYAVNALKKYWLVGYGLVHLPCKPGYHQLEILTWKVAPVSWFDSLKEHFRGGGLALTKADHIFTGLERFKLLTQSSGVILMEVNLVFRNFSKFGIECN